MQKRNKVKVTNSVKYGVEDYRGAYDETRGKPKEKEQTIVGINNLINMFKQVKGERGE